MSGHDKAAFVDCEDRYVIDVTRCLDFPDDPVSQHDDPLPPQSGVNDKGQEGSAAQQHTKDYPACNKDYKTKDALSRASNQHQLPISWHLRDVPDFMIIARTARAANWSINTNSHSSWATTRNS
jgi:hypothetical protein